MQNVVRPSVIMLNVLCTVSLSVDTMSKESSQTTSAFLKNSQAKWFVQVERENSTRKEYELPLVSRGGYKQS
jgi:hypothetical protein